MAKIPESMIPVIQSHLAYNPETGICTWLIRKNNSKLVGSIAGTWVEDLGGKLRCNIKIQNRSIYRARIAFIIMTGKIPLVIDHINGNPSDDRWANLREVTRKENSWNRVAHRKSGQATGVRFHGGKYQARIGFNGRTRSVGNFKTFEEAAEAVREARLKFYGVFARGAA